MKTRILSLVFVLTSLFGYAQSNIIGKGTPPAPAVDRQALFFGDNGELKAKRSDNSVITYSPIVPIATLADFSTQTALNVLFDNSIWLRKTGTTTYNTGTKVKGVGSTYYERITELVLTPEMFGAVGDSITNDTQALVNLFNSLGNSSIKQVLLKKVYRVVANSIALPGNVKISSQSGGRIVTNSTSGFILQASNVSNISLDGVDFYAPNGNVKALGTNKVKNITITNVDCKLVGLLQADSSQYVTITYCTGTNSYTAASRGNTACVDLVFTSDVLVDNSTFNGYNFGVQYWGGDANPITNPGTGARTPIPLSVPRGCQNITVQNTTCNDTYAGIWGSMGRNIKVDNCTAILSRDVGIDFEGTINGTISNSTARDATNGGLSTFFLCDSIYWKNNITSCSAAGQLAFSLAGNGGLSGTIVIDNLTSLGVVETYGGYLYGAGGGYKNLKIINSSFTNVGIDLHSVISHIQYYDNNKFISTISVAGQQFTPGNCIAIGTERGVLTVKNSYFINQYAINLATFIGNGPSLYHADDPIMRPYTFLDNNEFNGFSIDCIIKSQQNTTVSGRTALALITNNRLYNNNIFAEPASGSNLSVGSDYRNNTYGSITSTIQGANFKGTANFNFTNGTVPNALLQVNDSGEITNSAVDLNQYVKGNTSQSRAIPIATGNITTTPYPSGFYAIAPAVTGMPQDAHSWVVTIQHYESSTQVGGGTYKLMIATDLVDETSIWTGRTSNTNTFSGWTRMTVGLITGTTVASGNGSATTFVIPHGLGVVPEYYNVQAGNSDTKNISFLTRDATNITVNYTTAPPTGSNNLLFVWSVKK